MATTKVFQLLSLLSLVYMTIAFPTSSLLHTNIVKRHSVVQFAVDLTWADYDATGGVVRKAILINGTIPGPPLRMQIGQTVEFTVHNGLPFATSVHFHGISQRESPWSDGVTGLTQHAIPAGKSFLYKWKADEAGTYFYHAHHKGQMMDGLYGAIIIEADEDTERPFSLIATNEQDLEQITVAELINQPVFISDWSQYTFEEFNNIQKAVNIDNSCADAIIVNGKGSVYCQSRTDIDAWTPASLKPLLQAVNPPQLTNKGCFPPNLPGTQGNFTFNLKALPPAAYFNCTPSTGTISEIKVSKADGWTALTFINSGGFSSLKFTIDNHKVWVYAVDGAYVKPQLVDQVVVNVGERYSVMIKLDQVVGTYKIQVANNGLNQILSGYAALVYEGSTGPAPGTRSVMNYAGINTTLITKFDDSRAAPFEAIKPAATADVTFFFNLKKQGQPAGAYEWTLSGVHGYNTSNDDIVPILYQDPSTLPYSDLIFKTKYGQWVDLIVRIQGPAAQPHPLHKHANKAFVLGQGVGSFNYSSVAEAAAAMPSGTFNFENPPYRDTFMTTPASGSNSWIALRYIADAPGAWAFHCHIQTHYSGGMAVVLMDAVDKDWAIPSEYREGNGFPLNSPDYTPLANGGYNYNTTTITTSNNYKALDASGSGLPPKPTASFVAAAYTGAATPSTSLSYWSIAFTLFASSLLWIL